MRLAVVAVTAALSLAGGLAASSAQAGDPVLDGKVVKKLRVVQEAKTGAAALEPSAEQLASCKAPACARLSFVYKPAKGIVGNLSVTERNFYVGLGDEDLYVLKGSTVLASCTGTMSNKRYVSLPMTSLKSGTTYTVVMYYSHEIGESTSFDVEFPGRPAPKSTDLNPDKPFDYAVTMCGT